MKKLLAVSFIALSAVSAANADVASVAYVQNALSTKQNAITTDNKLGVDKIYGLATVATSGSYNDLSNKPTIPTVPTNVSAFTNDAGYITSASIPAQVQADWTATGGNGVILNKPTLATVATSGSYNDLTNKPTIDSALSGSSTNAVQNKVVSAGLNRLEIKMDDFASQESVAEIEGAIGIVHGDLAYSSDNTIADAIAAKQDTIPANTYDAYGAAAAVEADIDAKLGENFNEENTVADAIVEISQKFGGDFYFDSKSDHWTVQDALDEKQDTISDLSTIRSGAEAGATALQPGSAINGANITAGTVAKSALASGVQTSLDKADTALQAHQTITTGGANGTIAVAGSDVAVKGLGSAAYTASTDYATSAQGALAGTALQPNTPITPGTATKVTYDANGLITAGTTLSESDIPAIPESRVTNLTTDLTNAQNKIPSGSEGASTLASVWLE